MLTTLIAVAPASQAQAPIEPAGGVLTGTVEMTAEPPADDAVSAVETAAPDPTLPAEPPAETMPQTPVVDINEPGGMPLAYPDPEQPIPYNKPGRLSKIGIDTRLELARTYQPWASQVSVMSAEEAAAALAYSATYDPFIGQRTLVEWDNLAVMTPGANNAQRFRTWKGIREQDSGDQNALNLIKDVTSSGVNAGFVRTGDINGDGVDEVVSVTGDAPNNILQVGNLSDQRFSKGTPAIVSPQAGAIWVLGRGYDDGLWGRLGGDWQQLGGGLTSSPSGLTTGGVAHVFLLGDGSDVFRCALTAGMGWCNWKRLGIAPAGYFVGEPAAAMTDPNAFDVFARGSDNTLWRLPNAHWETENRTDWENLGGYITSPPAAVGRGDGRVDVVALGYDGAVWRMWRAHAGAAWSAWERLPGSEQFKYAPAIVSPAPGALDVFAVDPGYDAKGKAHPVIKRNQLRGNSWSGWSQLPGSLPSPPASAPAATLIQGSSTVALIYRGADGRNYETWLNSPTPSFNQHQLLGMWSAQYRGTKMGEFELGHFKPDGRMQAIHYRVSAAKQLFLAAYGFGGSSGPGLYATTTFALTDGVALNAERYTAVGDYDGDSSDELALQLKSAAYTVLYIFELDGDGKPASVSAEPLYWRNDTAGSWLQLTSGDYNGDGHDELALLRCTEKNPGCYLQAYDVSRTTEDGKTVWAVKPLGSEAVVSHPNNTTDHYLKSLAMTSGDFITEPKGQPIVDEIVYTGIFYKTPSFLDHDRHYLKTYVYRLANNNLEQKGSKTDEEVLWHPASDTEPGFRVAIAGADLQRNRKERIAIYVEYTTRPTIIPPPGKRRLYIFEQGTSLALKEDIDVDGETWNSSAVGTMVAGNISGEGLRTAQPTYRLITDVGKLVARVSAPPKIYDVNYNNPNTTGDLHVVNPDSKATITLKSEQNKKISVEAKSHWNLDAKLEGTLGDKDESHITATLEGSVGQDFSHVKDSSATSTWGSEISSPEDQFLYALTDFQLYEYPVMDPADNEQSHMTVTTPKGVVEMGKYGVNCDLWINPGHEVNNLFSYPADKADLPGHEAVRDYLAFGVEYDASADAKFVAEFASGRDDKFEENTNWSVTAGIEGEYSGGVGSVSASVEGEYGQTAAATVETSTNETIGVGGTLQPLGDAERRTYNHYAAPYFYWTADKTLVLDYVTRPSDAGWWLTHTWTLPDLAFLLPLRGRACGLAQGMSRDDQSPDITFSDNTPMTGSTVTATATVHNYSKTDVTDGVKVKFYRGDPSAGGVLLCEKSVPRLDARKTAQAACEFEATGFGEQRIYAVGSPSADSVTERDVTNNKGYGVLTVVRSSSAALDADPGLVNRKPGALLSLDTGGGRLTRFFAPYASLDEQAVTSFKLETAGARGRSFTIAATRFSGGAWMELALTFGLKGSSRDYGEPTAWVSVEYTDADPGLGDENQIGLFYWDTQSRRWINTSTVCGPVVRDTANNELQGPVCRTGRYALAPVQMMTYLPAVQR